MQETSPEGGTCLDAFPVGRNQPKRRQQLPLACALIEQKGRSISIAVNLGLHPDCDSVAREAAVLEWDTLKQAEEWAFNLQRAAATVDSRSRAIARRYMQQQRQEEEERQKLRAEQEAAAERLGKEVDGVGDSMLSEAAVRPPLVLLCGPVACD